jgi:hypothetical protein
MKHNAKAIITTGIVAPLLLMALAPCAMASEKAPHRVPRVNSHITVDGILDEHIWNEALDLSIAYEVRPGENVPPPVETDVLLAYDDTHLYCAFKAYDPDPSKICARLCDRDNMWDDDWVVLNLDTFNDQRRSYLFVCNPLGIQADCIEVTGGESTEWDPIWDSAGSITDEGYIVEMAIPFSSLRFQRTEEDQIWGVDLIRSYPREVRHHLGLFPRDRDNNCYLCQAEKLIGFAGATPGRNIEFDPTFSTIHTKEREEVWEDFGSTKSHYDFGLTASWGLTPNMILNGTVNPDFSQVEADAAQLDINTQFAIFYSERRPFFLESADLFASRLNVVHTRRLADPRWGLKLTGKEGSSAIGAFVVEDDITNILVPGPQGSDRISLARKSTSAVVRYRRDISRSSVLGLFMTGREADGYYNRMAGVDGTLRFTSKDCVRFEVLGSQTAYPETVYTELDQPFTRFGGRAYDLFYIHETRGLDFYGVYREIEPEFRADLGFRPQVGTRYGEVGWGHTWHGDGDNWWNMLNFGSDYEQHYEYDDGDLIHKGFAWWFNYSGRKQSFANMWGFFGKYRYDDVEFDRRRIGGEAGLWPTGSLFVMFWGEAGDEVDYDHTRDGRQLSAQPYVVYKAGRHLELSLKHTYDRLDVEAGRLYTANISWLRTVYQFNSRMFLRAILQHVHYERNKSLYEDPDADAETTEFLSQVLFSYKVNPQTMVFVGYSDFHYGNQEYDLTQTDRTVFAKVGYALTL